MSIRKAFCLATPRKLLQEYHVWIIAPTAISQERRLTRTVSMDAPDFGLLRTWVACLKVAGIRLVCSNILKGPMELICEKRSTHVNIS